MDFLVGAVIVLLMGGAGYYIQKQLRAGNHCIGCSQSGQCGGCSHSSPDEGEE